MKRRYRKTSRKAPPPWLGYGETLVRLFDRLEKLIEQKVYPKLFQLARVRKDAASDEFKDTMQELRTTFEQDYIPDARTQAREHARRTILTTRQTANEQAKTLLGIQPFAAEPYLNDFVNLFVESNVGLIKSVGDQYLTQIGDIMARGALSGKSTQAIKEELMERAGVTENKAKLIARDQTSKLNSNLTALRMGRLGIDRYEWSASLDERTRDDHVANDGKIFRWDDPPATGHPGEDINCRCVALPVLVDSESGENE